jgi:hypothetical protein
MQLELVIRNIRIIINYRTKPSNLLKDLLLILDIQNSILSLKTIMTYWLLLFSASMGYYPYTLHYRIHFHSSSFIFVVSILPKNIVEYVQNDWLCRIKKYNFI